MNPAQKQELVYKIMEQLQDDVKNREWEAIEKLLFNIPSKVLAVYLSDPDDYLAPTLSTEYWDCECTVDYIHSKRYSECLRCNSIAEDQPDSHLREVRKLKKEFK